jgi:hypothetical protein
MTTSDIFTNQRQIWKDYQFYYAIARRSLPFIIGLVVGGILFASDDGYFTNLYTEVLSIVTIVGVLDYLNKRDRQNEKIQDLQQSLIRDARRKVKDTAITAIEDLRTYGWLTGDDGLLQEANLQGANLQEAYLQDANLTGADLSFANLTGADLSYVNLQGVELLGVNLTGAKLWRANLTGAILLDANLRKANLRQATLPDGTEWAPDTDMARFTNPYRPDFWIPKQSD